MPHVDVDLPSTLERSPKHAQDVWAAALASAEETYGPGERARRTAFAALKHGYEKVGDHWEQKAERGPSDDAAAGEGGTTAQGVDARASEAHLSDVARRLEIPGRSTMTKAQLVEAIEKANAAASRRARP
jgi:cation transport regulator ChaB